MIDQKKTYKLRKIVKLLVLLQTTLEVSDDCIVNGFAVQKEKNIINQFYKRLEDSSRSKLIDAFQIDEYTMNQLTSNYDLLAELISRVELEDIPNLIQVIDGYNKTNNLTISGDISIIESNKE